MNDAEYEAQKARLHALSEKWIKPIGLGWWTISQVYSREGIILADAKGHYKILGETEAHWEYMDASIRWDMEMVAAQSDDDLEYCFVHELMHILLAELHDNYSTAQEAKHAERTCTVAAKALMWARAAGFDDGLAAQHERVLQEA